MKTKEIEFMKSMKTRPVCLIIMDGYAKSDCKIGNAILEANNGTICKLMNQYPATYLGASGMSVGLPEGQMGNSEVGHLNIGAGRIVYQELTRITKSIMDGDFYENKEFVDAIDNAIKNKKKIHFCGLLSNGGVHSHNTHLYALLELAKRRGATKVFVHCFMDGRDVSPTSGIEFVKELELKLKEIGVGKIASISGRYYSMDRDNNWSRVEKAYNAMVLGDGNTATNAVKLVEESYKNEVTDEFIKPTTITRCGKAVGLIGEGDSIICFNFRPDRAREITRCLSQEDFNSFERKTGFLKPNYVCFTKYDATFKDVNIAFKAVDLNNTLGVFLANKGYTQLRIAETEKYAHVTFFFNGGVEKPNENEFRVLINSPKVATYDLKPEMSAPEVTDAVLKEISSDKFDVIILNYANCDMVGHTGILDAATKAVDTVENCVQKVVDAILAKGGTIAITADHGNAEKLIDDDGSAFTAHTTNPVPFILVGENYKGAKLRDDGILADIAPTLLEIVGEEKPAEMTGTSLIIKW